MLKVYSRYTDFSSSHLQVFVMKKFAMRIPFSLSCLLLLLLWAATFAAIPNPVQPGRTAIILEVKGVIGPVLSEYIQNGIAKASQQKVSVLILEMDTPGGLDSSMRAIIKDILASPVPVVTYVAPEGSRAASAGTYILYASHIAAMAPATNLGAATPIRIGDFQGKEKPADSSPEDEKKEPITDPLQKKMINDAEAYIRALADRHNRNADWGAKAVREAVSLTAKEALQEQVIDIVAADIEDLLVQMNNREVAMTDGHMTIYSADLTVERLSPDWRTRFLLVITDPNVAYILMLLGMYGLFFELANPGNVLPGVIGAIALVMALYTFQILPVNYAGLLLIIIGLTFMVSEAFIPSFGALGLGGITAFVIGSIILIDEPDLKISYSLIASTVISSAVCLILVLRRLLTIRRQRVRTGAERMIDSLGEAMEDFTGEGRIWIHGESWLGKSSRPVERGQTVRVIAQDGLTLHLEIIEEDRKNV